MLGRIVWRNIWRRKGRKVLIWSIMAVSAMLVSALMTAAVGYERTLERRLQRLGPNLVVVPEAAAGVATFRLGDWRSMMTIFWRNNLAAIVPVYYTAWWSEDRGEKWPVLLTFLNPIGAKDSASLQPPEGRSLAFDWRDLSDGWQISGRWPASPSEVLVGIRWAQSRGLRPGDMVTLRTESGQVLRLQVAGIVQTQGREDSMVLVDWRAVGPLTEDRPVHRFYVRAVTLPEPAVPVRLENLPPAEQEKWLCQPYPTSIAYQIQQALPNASAYPLQQVIHQETAFWKPVQRLVLAVTAAIVAAMLAGMGVVMSGLVRSRTYEIALFHTLGASPVQIGLVFCIESSLMAVTAALTGWVLGTLALRVGPGIGGILYPGFLPEVGGATLLLTTLITGLVTLWAVRRELRRIQPAVLHEVAIPF